MNKWLIIIAVVALIALVLVDVQAEEEELQERSFRGGANLNSRLAGRFSGEDDRRRSIERAAPGPDRTQPGRALRNIMRASSSRSATRADRGGILRASSREGPGQFEIGQRRTLRGSVLGG